jgi:hypothetical protein
MRSYHSLNVVPKLRICTASPPLHLHTFKVSSLGIGEYLFSSYMQYNGKMDFVKWLVNLSCNSGADISLFFIMWMRQGSVHWYCSLKWLHCTSPNNKWVWSIGQGETKVSEKKLCQSHFVHHISHTDYPETESGPPQQDTSE